MATLKKKLLITPASILGFLIALQSAFAQGVSDKLPEGTANYVTIITSPWPEYTFGMLYFLILMACVLGILLHTGLTKAKIFGEGFGMGSKGISVAMTVILTLIVIKFMPFSYYFILLVLIMIMATIAGLHTVLKGMTSYGEMGDRANVFIIGIALTAIGFVTNYLAETFVKYEVNTLGAPVIGFAWISGIVGVVISIIGGLYLIKPGDMVSKFGGTEGVKVAATHELDDIAHERKWEQEELIFSQEIAGLVREAIRFIEEGETKKATKVVEKVIKEFKKKLKVLRSTLTKARRLVVESESVEGTVGRVGTWESGIERLEKYILKLERHIAGQIIKEERGLHKVAKLLHAGDNTEALNIMRRVLRELQRIEEEELHMRPLMHSAAEYAAAVEHAAGAGAAGAAVGAGAMAGAAGGLP